MDLGPHATFILASYGAAATLLLLLVLWVWIDHHVQRRALDALEAKGITRRSVRAETSR